LAEVLGDKPVITVCHAGMRSGQATVLLRNAGLMRVANLKGGMLLWQQMGLPVERDFKTAA
jgi:rhodanese-related sulfurtransferase